MFGCCTQKERPRNGEGNGRSPQLGNPHFSNVCTATVPLMKAHALLPLRKSTESSPSCGFSTSVSPFPAIRETPSFGLFRRGGKEQSVGGTPFFVETYPQEISRRTDRWRQGLRRRCHYPRSDPKRGDTVPLASQSTPVLQGNRTHVSSLSLFPGREWNPVLVNTWGKLQTPVAPISL